MNAIEKGRAAGLVILLDGRVGQQAYHTVSGSLAALERFAALCSRGGGERRRQESASGQRRAWSLCRSSARADIGNGQPGGDSGGIVT